MIEGEVMLNRKILFGVSLFIFGIIIIACSQTQNRDIELIGKWIDESQSYENYRARGGGVSMIYSIEFFSDGTGSRYNDVASITSSFSWETSNGQLTLTLLEFGNVISYYYEFENGFLQLIYINPVGNNIEHTFTKEYRKIIIKFGSCTLLC
jgi:hypothetical protein